MRFILSMILLGLVGCLNRKEKPNLINQSRILVYEGTAVMDTLTAIIEGQILSMSNHEGLSGKVKLTKEDLSYSANADAKGQFTFFHIQPGNYRVSCELANYSSLKDTLIELGSGRIMSLQLG